MMNPAAREVRLFLTRIRNRLTGFPVVTMYYRADWRFFSETHSTILILIEDSPRGEVARQMLPIWLAELEQ